MPGKEKDPAFLYYETDVALDISLLNRLERGCYLDLVQQYRKYGGYTTVLLRKILGTDFESCWNALELILEYDKDTDTYHIGWLRLAVQKRSENSDTQRERILKFWDDVAAGRRPAPVRGNSKNPRNKKNDTAAIPEDTTEIPRNTPGNTEPIPTSLQKIPIENGNGNTNENKDRIEDEEGGMGEGEGGRKGGNGMPAGQYVWKKGPPWPDHQSPLPEKMVDIFVAAFPDYPKHRENDQAGALQLAYAIAQYRGWPWEPVLNREMGKVLDEWQKIVEWITSDSFYKCLSLSSLAKNFQGLIQAKNNGRSQNISVEPKPGTSEARTREMERW